MTTIVVRTQAEFIHRYKDAPKDVEFLREWHRHMLHIEVEVEVNHDDRELEFIMIKRALNAHLGSTIELKYVEKSCETLGKELSILLCEINPKLIGRKMKISVFEDGENGGVYYHNCEM